MLLECTKCGTKYRVKDTVAADYSFTCKKCDNLVRRANDAVESEVSPASTPADSRVDAQAPTASEDSPMPTSAESTAAIDSRNSYREGTGAQPVGMNLNASKARSEAAMTDGGATQSPPLRTKRPWILVVLLFLIFLVVAAHAAWFFVTSTRQAAHSPETVSASMLPALEDLAAVQRAERCSELLEQLAEFKAGKPYVVQPVSEYSQDRCEVVAKGKPEEKFSVGGFRLSQWVPCDQARKDFDTNVSNHENNLEVKVKLYCGPDGKPSVEADQSALLAAQAQLQKRLPNVVKAVNEGRISSDISACYFGVKAQVSATAEEMRKLRCKVLTADMAVPRVTYDALWERAALMDELEQFKKENSEEWESLSKTDGVTLLLERFTSEARETACAETNEPSVATISAAAAIAAQTCM